MTRLAVVLLVLVLLAAPPAAEAQPAGNVYRIGALSSGFAETLGPRRPISVFRARLRELGYREGENVVLDFRYAEGDSGRLPALAAELVRLRPSVIVALGSFPTAAAKRATATIPIVMAATLDPVREGLVSSLPGSPARFGATRGPPGRDPGETRPPGHCDPECGRPQFEQAPDAGLYRGENLAERLIRLRHG